MLKIENLVVRYGMIEAIKGISFHVDDGEIVTLIGSNGAGKTTTMHAISGLLKPARWLFARLQVVFSEFQIL